MRVMIVDDEMLARAVLREYLGAHAGVKIVAECANGFDAVKAIIELAPDLVLLDIQMPRLDGFEVAELTAGKTRFIFVTAFDQYALKAFEHHALDYLLKPFSQQRFDQALLHASKQLGAAPQALPSRQQTLARIVIRDGARVHVIASHKIDSVEAQDDYVQIRTEGRAYLKNQRLSELESQLDPSAFLRVHRSWLVNVDCISRIEAATKDSYCAILKDGTKIPVSKAGYQKVRALMQ